MVQSMRERHFIDSHKGITCVVIVLLIAWHDAWNNPTALVYLGLHGSYGLLWLVKSRFFPDKSWERSCSLLWGLVIWAGLTLYWIAPWIITRYDVRAPAWLLAVAVSTFAFGLFLHFCADMQKYLLLSLRPRRLITTGLWSRLRNPNYLGELLIYLAFALLAMHWLPLLVLFAFVFAYWLPNMLRKDRSLSRYESFAAYRSRSWLFIPFVF